MIARREDDRRLSGKGLFTADRRPDALAPLGVRHLEMPATPERVWAAIRRSAG